MRSVATVSSHDHIRRGNTSLVSLILQSFEDDPAVALTTADIAMRAYGVPLAGVQKKHRVAVLRAMKSAMKRNPKLDRMWGYGHAETTIYNTRNLASRIMASLKSSNLGYHECRTEEQLLEFWRDRYLRSRDLEKEWSREIERLIAQDEGDEAMLARLDAEDRTKAEEAGRLMQEMLETIGKHYICPHCGKNTLDAPLSGQQTA